MPRPHCALSVSGGELGKQQDSLTEMTPSDNWSRRRKMPSTANRGATHRDHVHMSVVVFPHEVETD